MTKKKQKKLHLRLLPICVVLLIIIILFFLIQWFLTLKTENVVITGNSYVTDQEIMELSGLIDYPEFYRTTTSMIKRKLLANPYIKSVQVERKFYHKFVLNIEEYQLLYQQASDGKVMTETGEVLMSEDKIIGIPLLLNYVPDTKEKSFIEGMSNMKEEIRKQISEITYVPNDYDKDRFLLLMDDGNSVYLTLTKFDMINYYDEVLPQLEGRKGILYLDSGNHFQIME